MGHHLSFLQITNAKLLNTKTKKKKNNKKNRLFVYLRPNITIDAGINRALDKRLGEAPNMKEIRRRATSIQWGVLSRARGDRGG